MPVEEYQQLSESTCKVTHSIPNDSTWGSYKTLILVDKGGVIVKTPLACPRPLSNVEVQSVVQLLLGRAVTIGVSPVDTCDHFEEPGCPRCWQTYSMTL